MDIKNVDIVTGDYLVNHGLKRKWCKVWIIVILVSLEKHFIRVCENFSQYPRIIHPLSYHKNSDTIFLNIENNDLSISL